MRFKIFSSSHEGMTGGQSSFTEKEVVKQLSDFRGWNSMQDLVEAVKDWILTAKPGSVFATRSSVVVATASNDVRTECSECLSDNISCGEFDCHEDGEITQRCVCDDCGAAWEDVFYPTRRKKAS